MKDRLKKAKRIVDVQAQMHRQAEWRQADLARQKVELERVREDLIGTLNSDTFGPLLVEVVARNLRRLAAEATRLSEEQERQAAKVREEALRLKRAERMAGGVDRAYRQHEERQMVAGILEGVASKIATESSSDEPPRGDASPT